MKGLGGGGGLSWIPTVEQIVSCFVCSELCGRIHHSAESAGPLLIKSALSEQDGLSDGGRRAADPTRRTSLRVHAVDSAETSEDGDKSSPAPVSLRQQGVLRS